MDATKTQIERLQAQIAAQREFIDAAMARTVEEDRDLTDVEQSNIDQAKADVERFAADLARLTEFHNSVAAAEKLAPVKVERAAVTTSPRPEAPKSVGDLFADSEQLRGYRAGTSNAFELESILPGDFAARGAVLGADGTSVWDEMGTTGVSNPVVNNYPGKQRPLLGVISRAQTNMAAVPVLRIKGDEAGAAKVAEGAQKPEVTWTETFDTLPVPTIAGYKKASRQVLDDFALVRATINDKLSKSVLNALEAEILTAINGGITGANTTTGTGGADLLKVIREGIGQVEGRGHQPNAVMLNPADYAGLDISVLGSTLLGPVVGSSFWGLQVVSNPNVSAGSAIVGDFSTAVTLYERQGMSMFITDSDISGEGATAKSDFRANLVTFLAELRALPVCLDESAIQKCVPAGSLASK